MFALPSPKAGWAELAAKPKKRCGAGRTVKNRRIEIQGDNCDGVIAELKKLVFKDLSPRLSHSGGQPGGVRE